VAATPLRADETQTPGANPALAPRPPAPPEIAAMMAAAEAQARQAEESREGRRLEMRSRLFQHALFGALWGGLAVAAAAAAYVLSTDALGASGYALAALVGAFAVICVAAAFRPGSSVLLASAAFKRASGKTPVEAAQLAGSEILESLAIAGRVLDADPDARLVSRRDGVVIYANAAYFALARDAGVIGPAGLPPRIDRLFAQQGAEATKVFRLCRAAKSAAAAEEIVYQQIGLAGGGARRRFEVSTRPVADAGDYIAWRLRELPIEEKEHDVLAASYADFPRPVFALEKSGQIAWANAAMRRALGLARNELQHVNDVILGETAEGVRALWRADGTGVSASVRRRDADPGAATFAAFRRGGIGEGFVCVLMSIEAETAEAEDSDMSGDISEAPFGLAVIEGEIGRDARIVEANRTFHEAFDWARKNTPLARVFSATAIDEIAEEVRRNAVSGAALRAIDAVVGAGPTARTYGLYARPQKRRRGSYGVRRTFLYTLDITDRKQMEQVHAQDQKLKAIGFIAGEVAHDFNNLLQVIQGNCEQLMLRHPAGDPAYQDLVLIRENAQRAANLTKQLLAYSRTQTLTRKVQSITDILLDFSRFLDRAVGDRVKVEFVNGRGLPDVKVDRTQIETAIMNLAVNARDAMAPHGGTLTIRTSLVAAADIKSRGIGGLGEQDHVLLELADTGPGVPPEIADKIFEPFYTTKEEGKGTGLGLSTVHGIIGQMGGAIMVENAQGGGAVFKVYLPAHLGPADAKEDDAPAGASVSADYSGSGRILVVEDEDPVRAFVVATLERSGYEVTHAEDGVAALEILKDDREFDLIVSDVMMPGIDGPTFVATARAELGVTAAVIFMSGYAEASVREQMDQIEGVRYIQKPFPMAALGASVKDALYERAKGAGLTGRLSTPAPGR